jgi:hypothetical protein
LHYQRTQTTPTPQRKASAPVCEMLATTIHKSNTTPHHQSRATTTKLPRRKPTPNLRVCLSPVSHHSGRRDSGPVVSKPNSVSGSSLTEKSSPKTESRPGSTFVVHQTPTHYR